jgi:hypothetical protein
MKRNVSVSSDGHDDLDYDHVDGVIRLRPAAKNGTIFHTPVDTCAWTDMME